MNNYNHHLIQEYVKKLRYIVLWPLTIAGICRFDIRGDRVVKKSIFSIIITIFILVVTNYCALHILYHIAYKESYLILPEIFVVVMFDIFHNGVLLNMLTNRNGVTQFINIAIELDTFLGVEETEFMREISARIYVILVAVDGSIHVLLITAMFFTYLLPESSVYLSAAIYFTLLFYIYYDLAFFVTLYTFLTLRVRYLNISIMKIAEIDPECFPSQFPFNAVFWNKRCDDLVEFHTRAAPEQIIQAFRMVFNQLRCLEKCYRFTIFLSLTYVTIGTFVIVQNFIMHAKLPDLEALRLITLTSWGVLSAAFQVGMTQQTDMFYRQIKQTNLVCNYIQLKPMYPEGVYKLTKGVIRTLDVRDARVSIYGLFYYDTGLMLSIGSSLFVYITMQLQIAFPKIDEMPNNLTVNYLVE